VIVSDAGPLIVLLQINKLSILKETIGTVKVPMAVYDEVTVKDREKAIFSKAEWLKPVKVKKDNDYKLLEELVDNGEAEAIILAKQLKLPLLADDAKARKYATLLNVEVMGTLGLLKLAKSRGVISSVKDVIKEMLAEGYYVDGRLIAKLLADVGES
jgi:predicted nucleic acid-binding protein